jgi:hypothetical protein
MVKKVSINNDQVNPFKENPKTINKNSQSSKETVLRVGKKNIGNIRGLI